MSRARTESSARHERAAAALAGLGSHRADHQRLGVQCRHSHHVAELFDTPEGLVFHATTGPRAHGSKDREDVAHHAAEHGTPVVDLLDAGAHADDGLLAWCDCGPWTLSRRDLLAAVARREHVLHVG